MRMIKRLFSREFSLLPFYTYKLVELFVFPSSTNPCAILLRAILTSFLVLVLCPTIIVLGLFYDSVEIYLRIKHGAAFCSMLDGCDRIWVVRSPSKNIINAIYALTPTGDPNLPSELLAFFREKYSLIAKTHPRFSSVIKSHLGLQYYHKIKYDVRACVTYMDEYSSTAEFYALLDTRSNAALPKDDSYLWEINVGRKLITWHDGEEVYPLVVRKHHSLGDGVSLVTLMTTFLLEDGVDLMRKKCDVYKAILQKNVEVKRLQKQNGGARGEAVVKGKQSVLMKYLSKRFYYPTLAYPEKDNLLHGPAISGNKQLIFVWEKPGDDYFEKVKRVKNHYKMAFADVISTAISASLSAHFAKYSKTRTESLLTMNPYFLVSPDFDKIVHMDEEGNPIINLGNKFAMGFTQLPIDLQELEPNKNARNNNTVNLKTEANELLRRLRAVQRTNNRLKNALDFLFCYWQMRMFAGLPLGIGKWLLLVNDASLSVSNVPGNATARLANGVEVKDTFVFGNNYGNIGVSITLFTYDERFRIGLLVDKSIIPDKDVAQALGDGILKYIDDLVDTLPKSS